MTELEQAKLAIQAAIEQRNMAENTNIDLRVALTVSQADVTRLKAAYEAPQPVPKRKRVKRDPRTLSPT